MLAKALNEETVQSTASSIGEKVTGVVADAANQVEMAKIIKDITDEFSSLDVLVNNGFGEEQAYEVKKAKTVCLPSR